MRLTGHRNPAFTKLCPIGLMCQNSDTDAENAHGDELSELDRFAATADNAHRKLMPGRFVEPVRSDTVIANGRTTSLLR